MAAACSAAARLRPPSEQASAQLHASCSPRLLVSGPLLFLHLEQAVQPAACACS